MQHSAVHEGLLGTRVSLRLRGEGDLEAAEHTVITEIERLEQLLSAYSPTSAWSRWRAGTLTDPPEEIVELLRCAQHWHARSEGAFSPAVGVLRARWLRAVTEQIAPTDDELVELASQCAALPYHVHDDDTVERLGDCRHLDLHALAKGWIVDRAAQALGEAPGIDDLLLNAGGDLRHIGTAPITVGIEDPRRPFDNVPPLERVRFSNRALAASSGSRRPHIVAGRRSTHVLDPRTGRPVEHVAAVSALAPDAATADVVATIVGVLPLDAGHRFVDGLGSGIAVWVLDAHGTLHRSVGWPSAST